MVKAYFAEGELTPRPWSRADVAELERLAKVAGAEERLAEIYGAELGALSGDDGSTVKLCKRTGEIWADLGKVEAASGDMAAPWFRESAFGAALSLLGEDLTFCLRCAAAGIPVHVHTGVQFGHVKPVMLGKVT